VKMTLDKRLGIIGGGAMGEALVRGVIKAGVVEPPAVMVSDVRTERLEMLAGETGVKVASSNVALARECDIVILAVKPFVVSEVLAEIAPVMNLRQTLISIAGGISLDFIEQKMGNRIPVVRVMPNTPCLVNEGASAFALGAKAGAEQAGQARMIFGAVGRVVEVPEKLMDAVTGLSGSGPAYGYLIIEALSDAGVRQGLPRDLATELAAQTLLGAARMVLETGEHPGRLKDMVTTPGGTTIEGLFALEEGAVRASISKAVEKAAARSREMSRRGGA